MIGWTGERVQHLDLPVYSTQKLTTDCVTFFGPTIGSDDEHYLHTNMHYSNVLPKDVTLRVKHLRFYSDPVTLRFLQRTAFMIIRILDRDMLILPCRILEIGQGYLSREFRVPLVLTSEASFLVILQMNECPKRNGLVTAIFEGITTRPM